MVVKKKEDYTFEQRLSDMKASLEGTDYFYVVEDGTLYEDDELYGKKFYSLCSDEYDLCDAVRMCVDKSKLAYVVCTKLQKIILYHLFVNDTGVVTIPYFVDGVYASQHASMWGSDEYDPVILNSKGGSDFENLKVITSGNINFTACLFYKVRCKTLDLSEFYTDEVRDMCHMFAECKIKHLDLSNFDTKNVHTMNFMFEGCTELESINLKSFDFSRASKVIEDGCDWYLVLEDFTGLDHLFYGCDKLRRIDVSNRTQLNYIKGTGLGCCDWYIDGKCVARSRNGQYANTKAAQMFVRPLDANTIQMSAMFSGCSNIKYLDLSHFRTSNVEDMTYMFEDCSNLEYLNLSNFDFEKAAQSEYKQWYTMDDGDCVCINGDWYSSDEFDYGEVCMWVSGIAGMFKGCTSLKYILVADSKQVSFIKNVKTTPIIPKGCEIITVAELSELDIPVFKHKIQKSVPQQEYGDKQAVVQSNMLLGITSGVVVKQTYYFDSKGIILPIIIQEIPKLYNISNRALEKMLHWQNKEFENYCSGTNRPTKQKSEILWHLYAEPKFYVTLLERNKAIITEIQYKNSKAHVLSIVQKRTKPQGAEKIEAVLKYIVGVCGAITPTAVQKLLYYVQGFSYIFMNTAIFTEDCICGKYGPLYKELYTKYKSVYVEPEKAEQLKAKAAVYLTITERQLVECICCCFGCFSDSALLSFIRLEQPFKNAIKQGEGTIISQDDIATYFGNLKTKYAMTQLKDVYKYRVGLLQYFQNNKA